MVASVHRKFSFDLLSPLLVGVTAVFFASPASAQCDINAAITMINRGEAKQALPILERVSQNDPNDPKARYFLGLALCKTNNQERALKEFQDCFQIDPFSEFAQMARKALLNAGPAFSGFNDSLEPYNPKKVYADDPRSLGQAVKSISKQAEDSVNKERRNGERIAASANRQGQIIAAKLDNEAEQFARDLNPYNRSINAALRQEIDSVRRKAQMDGQRVRTDAQNSATKHMRAAAQRSAEIEKTATNLLALISEKPKPGQLKLKALGTNLYVRNYGVQEPEPLIAEWHGGKISMDSNPEKQKKKGGQAACRVYGKLLEH